MYDTCVQVHTYKFSYSHVCIHVILILYINKNLRTKMRAEREDRIKFQSECELFNMKCYTTID